MLGYKGGKNLSDQSVPSKDAPRLPVYVWQLPVRLFHWINALAITVLFITGIYIGHPVLAPQGEPVKNFLMGSMRYWHGLAAFIYIANMGYRIYWFWVGNEYSKHRFWRKSFWQDLAETVRYYLFMKREHTSHVGHNSLAQLSYLIFIWLGGFVMILTGMALRASAYAQGAYAGFSWLIPLMKGESQVRTLHHLVAWFFAVFVIVHLYLAFRQDLLDDDGTVSSIINGYKFEIAEQGENLEHGDQAVNPHQAKKQAIFDGCLKEREQAEEKEMLD